MMNIKYIEFLDDFIFVEMDKCKICDICADHCDFGCPKQNIDKEIVKMKLIEICLQKDSITYMCLFNNKYIEKPTFENQE